MRCVLGAVALLLLAIEALVVTLPGSDVLILINGKVLLPTWCALLLSVVAPVVITGWMVWTLLHPGSRTGSASRRRIPLALFIVLMLVVATACYAALRTGARDLADAAYNSTYTVLSPASSDGCVVIAARTSALMTSGGTLYVGRSVIAAPTGSWDADEQRPFGDGGYDLQWRGSRAALTLHYYNGLEPVRFSLQC